MMARKGREEGTCKHFAYTLYTLYTLAASPVVAILHNKVNGRVKDFLLTSPAQPRCEDFKEKSDCSTLNIQQCWSNTLFSLNNPLETLSMN